MSICSIYIYIYIYIYVYIYIYWHVATDLKHNFIFPTEIALSTKRPDIDIWYVIIIIISRWSYLPTPPPGQDMTQGQFLSGV